MGTSMWDDIKEYGEAGDVPRLVDALVAVAQTEGYWGNKLNDFKRVLDVGTLSCRTRVAVALSERIRHLDENARTFLEYVVDRLIDDYGRTVDLAEAEAVLGIAAGYWYFDSYHLAMLGEIVLDAGRSLPDGAVAVIRRTAAGPYSEKTLRAFAPRIELPLLNPGEPMADRVIGDLSTLGEPWQALVKHAVTAAGYRPTPQWEERSRELLAAVGQGEARSVIVGWLALAGKPGGQPLLERGPGYDVELSLDPFNANAIRGLVWLLGLLPADAELARLLAGLVEAGLRKVPGIGPRHPAAAGAAIYALSRLDGPEGLAQLIDLTARVTNKVTLKDLHDILDERAAALRVTRDELEDYAVPSYGLTLEGRRTLRFGEDTATLAVANDRVSIEWRNATGLELGSAPSAVKANFAEELKQLKATAAEAGRKLTARTAGLQRDFAANRLWRFGLWRDHYLNHPLLGTVTRRLLWLVDGQVCGYAAGALRALDGSPVDAADTAEVAGFRPGDGNADTARAWLERHAIVQPFDQFSR